MNELATLRVDGPIATLTLNRPEQRNALSLGLINAISARVDELANRPDIKACVVTGAGRAFCAGMDLKQVTLSTETDASVPEALLTKLGELTIAIRALPCVTVAKINGAAIGGGCGLACVCDLAITHADAKVGYPEVDLGLCPAVVSPWVVSKIGPGRARAVLLRGGIMSGGDAHQIGLVDEVCAARDGLDALCGAIVGRLSTCGTGALAATKRLLNELDGSGSDAPIRGAAISAAVLCTPEAQKALANRGR